MSATEQKRPTLAGLNASIHNLVRSVESLGADVEDLKRPRVDFEASVAGRCATALDELKKAADRNDYATLSPSWQTGYGYDYQPGYVPPSGPIARVLDYLRQRYDLPDPSVEARRLAAELERAYGRMRDLETRLEQISRATS